MTNSQYSGLYLGGLPSVFIAVSDNYPLRGSVWLSTGFYEYPVGWHYFGSDLAQEPFEGLSVGC